MIARLSDHHPRIHLPLLNPSGSETEWAFGIVADAVRTSASPAHEAAGLLAHDDWRQQLLGMAALPVMPTTDHPAGRESGGREPVDALWERIRAGSWAGPQLAATAFLVDPSFPDRAGRQLVNAVETGEWENAHRHRQKTLTALAALAAADPRAEGIGGPRWIRQATRPAVALDRLSSDPHGARRLTWSWVGHTAPLLRRLGAPRLRADAPDAATPPRWTVGHGDLLDVDADVLICSANPELKLTGGVGGALLLRYGPSVQEELWQALERRGVRFVPRETVVATPGRGTPYRAVLHAVAIDASYRTTPLAVARAAGEALGAAATLGAGRVALTAVGTGFGPLSARQLGQALNPLIGRPFPPVTDVVIRVPDRDQSRLLATALNGAA